MSTMSFREKSAWVSVVSIGPVSAVYFFRLLQKPLTGTGGVNVRFTLLLAALLALLEMGMHVAIRLQSPEEARTPKDERDLLIDLKATRTAFPVLLISAFAAIATAHLRLGRDLGYVMMHVVLFGIIAAVLTRYGAQIVYHRRGF